jgi:hypothetical protein
MAGASRRIVLAAIAGAFIVLPGLSASAQHQEPTESRPTRSRGDSIFRVQIPRVSGGVKVDGVLNEPLWREAARLTGFTEVEPTPGAIPKDSTIGLVAYDHEYLYVAILAFGPQANIRAPVTSRDGGKLGNGYDGITLRLDTFNDARNAYVIQVNPRGVQADRSMREGDMLAGYYEDFVWKSGARVYSRAYTIEIAIPFTSIRFPAVDRFDIGFNIIRDYGTQGHQDSWAPRMRGSPCDICQEGVLEGIGGVSTRKALDLRPYIMAANTGSRALTIGTALDGDGVEWPAIVPGRWQSDEKDRRFGADVAVAITPSFVLNAAIHPDFSQIEASPEQVRVNRRFAVYYSDLRPFFTTGSDAFSTAGSATFTMSNAQVFYSRDVNDPTIGARLTGKRGRFLVAGLYAHDQHPLYYHYSGHESSGSDDPLFGAADVGVMRLRRDIRDDSYVGVLLTDREHGDAANRVVAADTRLRFGQFTLNFEGARSQDRLPLMTLPVDSAGVCPVGYTVTDGAAPRCRSGLYDGSGRNGVLMRGQLTYTDANFKATVSSGQVSSDFRAQLGNIGRVGIEQHTVNLNLKQYLKWPGWRALHQDLYGMVLNKYHGGMLDYQVTPKLSAQFTGSTMVSIFTQWERATFLGKTLDTRTSWVAGNLGIRKFADLGYGFNFGQEPIFDFANPRIGDGRLYQTSLHLYPMPAMTISPTFSRTIVREQNSGEKVVDVKLFYMTMSYQHTPALGMKAMAQLSDQWSGLLENPFLQQSAYTQSSVTIKYEIAPTSFVYCGINNERRRFLPPVVPASRYLQTGARVYFKMSYLVRL